MNVWLEMLKVWHGVEGIHDSVQRFVYPSCDLSTEETPFQDPPLGLTEHCWKGKTVPPILVQAFSLVSSLFAYIHTLAESHDNEDRVEIRTMTLIFF